MAMPLTVKPWDAYASPTDRKHSTALALSPSRAYRSPTVLVTVRSLASFLRIFSYSAMAFCSLPCCTNFSAALRTFCLLKPKPNAIGFPDSSLDSFSPSAKSGHMRIPPRNTRDSPGKPPPTAQQGSRTKVILRWVTGSGMITNDYRDYRKDVSVRVWEKPGKIAETRMQTVGQGPQQPPISTLESPSVCRDG